MYAEVAFQNIPPPPGRAEPPGAGAVTQKAPETPGQHAPAADGGVFGLLPLLLFIPLLIFLFWSSRSQQKKQEATVAGLKKGDRVVTQSGLIGRLLEIDQRYARIELAPGVKVQILRTSLVGRDAEEAPGKKAEAVVDKPSEKKA